MTTTGCCLENFDHTPSESASFGVWERKRKEHVDKTSKTPNKTPQVSLFLYECFTASYASVGDLGRPFYT